MGGIGKRNFRNFFYKNYNKQGYIALTEGGQSTDNYSPENQNTDSNIIST